MELGRQLKKLNFATGYLYVCMILSENGFEFEGVSVRVPILQEIDSRLFNDAVSIAQHQMRVEDDHNQGVDRNMKEGGCGLFIDAISLYLPVETEEDHAMSQSGQPVVWLGFQAGKSFKCYWYICLLSTSEQEDPFVAYNKCINYIDVNSFLYCFVRSVAN